MSLLAEIAAQIEIPLAWVGVVIGSLCTVIGVLYKGKTRAEARERKLLLRLANLAAVEADDED